MHTFMPLLYRTALRAGHLLLTLWLLFQVHDARLNTPAEVLGLRGDTALVIDVLIFYFGINFVGWWIANAWRVYYLLHEEEK